VNDIMIFTYQFYNLTLKLAVCHALVFSAELYSLTVSLPLKFFCDETSKHGLLMITIANFVNSEVRRSHCNCLDIMYDTK